MANFGATLHATAAVDVIVCGNEKLTFGDEGSDLKHWVYNYREAPEYIDVSHWFNYEIPRDSHEECVDYPDLFYQLLDKNCEKEIGSSIGDGV